MEDQSYFKQIVKATSSLNHPAEYTNTLMVYNFTVCHTVFFSSS